MKKMGVKIGLCILLIMPFTISFSANVSAEENISIKAAQDVVNIPDPALKSYLNGLLGQPSTSDITEAQMDTITDVTISNASLTDLTGHSYSVSSGTYDHYFDIDHSLTITNDSAISYGEQTTVTEEQFLKDVHAETDDGTPVTSDFNTIVDFSKPGVYTVTLNAENAAGLKATPTQVTVTILAKPVITADKSISYTKDTTKTEQQFLQDIAAKTSDGSKVTSDFDSVVDLAKVGTYKVTLNAVSADGLNADPVIILVNVVAGNEPPTPPGPSPDPTPDPTPNPNNPNINPNPDNGQSANSEIASNPSNSEVNIALPNTGDASQATTVLIGIILAGGAILFFRKRKHS
ncbi:LapB repeat-containing protein [Listeria monocytogenes]